MGAQSSKRTQGKKAEIKPASGSSKLNHRLRFLKAKSGNQEECQPNRTAVAPYVHGSSPYLELPPAPSTDIYSMDVVPARGHKANVHNVMAPYARSVLPPPLPLPGAGPGQRRLPPPPTSFESWGQGQLQIRSELQPTPVLKRPKLTQTPPPSMSQTFYEERSQHPHSLATNGRYRDYPSESENTTGGYPHASNSGNGRSQSRTHKPRRPPTENGGLQYQLPPHDQPHSQWQPRSHPRQLPQHPQPQRFQDSQSELHPQPRDSRQPTSRPLQPQPESGTSGQRFFRPGDPEHPAYKPTSSAFQLRYGRGQNTVVKSPRTNPGDQRKARPPTDITPDHQGPRTAGNAPMARGEGDRSESYNREHGEWSRKGGGHKESPTQPTKYYRPGDPKHPSMKSVSPAFKRKYAAQEQLSTMLGQALRYD